MVARVMRENQDILIIEDEDIIRSNITIYLEDCGYGVKQADNGTSGLELFYHEKPELVLLDLTIPGISGLDLIPVFKKDAYDMPVIVVSGTGDIRDAVEALKRGAWDFITKPITEMKVLEHSLNRAFERSNLIRENDRYRTNLEEEIRKRTAELEITTNELVENNRLLVKEIQERIFAEDSLKRSLDSVKRLLDGTIQTISLMAEIRDRYTAGHQQRVALLARAIAEEMNLSDDEIQGIYVAAMLHDIGKISIPIEILVKPGELTELEVGYIRLHPQTGYNILKMVEFPWPVAQIVLQHHERIDGSGYPGGLTGKYILKHAQILGVADVVESMASHRPYRGSLGIEAAIQEITTHADRRYDGRIVEACTRLFNERGFNFLEGWNKDQIGQIDIHPTMVIP